MSNSRGAYVGLDTGEHLTLLAFWTGRAEGAMEAMDRSWPLREVIQALSVSTNTAPIEIMRSIRELCAQFHRRPQDCLLVSMGKTDPDAAREWACGLRLRGTMKPPAPCALWSEGVLPARQVLEYVRPVQPQPGGADIPPTLNPTGGGDASPVLAALRDCFAQLMEQAADDVQRLKLDQDDSLLDRFVDLRPAGRPDVLTVPVESLTDPARLLRPFHAAWTARDGRADDPAPVEICTARVRCLITPPG